MDEDKTIDMSQLRELAGWISHDIKELHNVEVPKIWESFERYLNEED